LTEGALLALLGGAGGLVLAAWGTTALFRSMQRLLPLEIVYDTAPDPRVLAATLLFCALSTILFSLMPAWNLSRANVAHEIKGEKSSLFARRNLLVMAQLALSLVMLTAGGLFMRSAMRASNLDPGFRIDHSVLVDLDASLAGYDETRSRAAYAAVLDRLRAMPQVEAAGMAATTPFGMVSLGRDVRRTGSDAKQAPLNCRLNVVTADYFKAMGVPLVRGRAFTEAESAAGKAPPAVILDKPAAERLFPGADAVGQPVRLGGPDGRVAQVVGIVGEIQESIVGRKQRGHVFLPFGQEFQSMMSVHLKVTAEKPVLDAVRQEIRAVDPQLPVLGLASLRDHLDASFDIWMVRTAARMFSLFGGIALLLAAIGSYGVRAYVVERRTREIGIRMAIGASSADALRLVLREGLLLAGMGLGAGLLLSFAAGRALAGMLYQVSGADPLVFTVAPLLLATASLVACYIPARRAAHVDPMVALRYE
jgi:predicted permease